MTPLAGAGILMVCVPLTIWYSGAPLAAAVAGVFVYGVVSLWLPVPFSIAELPRLREIGDGPAGANGGSAASHEPALPDRKAA